VRSDSRDDLYVWTRTEWPPLPADRRSRATSSLNPSPESARKDGQVRQDPDLSHAAVRGLPGETAFDGGRRRVTARSCDPSLWRRDQSQRSAYARPAADTGVRRWRRNDQRRTAPGVSGAHAADEFAVDVAG